MTNGSVPNLAPGMQIPYTVTATLDGQALALPPGAIVNVALADNTTAQLAPDATPQPGTIASGFIQNVATPPPSSSQNAVNSAVTGATNPDGSPVDPAPPAPFTVSAGTPSGKIQLVTTLGAPVPASGAAKK